MALVSVICLIASGSSASQGGVVSDNTARLTGVAHRSVTGQPTDRTASPDCCGRWWHPSRSASVPGSSGVGREGDCRAAHRAIRFYTAKIREHARAMQVTFKAPRAMKGCPRFLAKRLRAKAAAWRVRYERWFHRTYEKWRCIHEHEGAWNDPNPPHYGGLQFDDSFQRTYGPEFFRRWGDAGRWPVWAQLVAAERAYRVRGFHPWPNTARMCGLIP